MSNEGLRRADDVARLDRFQDRLAVGLLSWSLASAATGFALLQARDKRWRDAGIQAIGWGAVDAAIALLGRRGQRRQRRVPAAERLPISEARKLRKLLWLNAGLDVGYVLGGLSLTRRPEARWHGHGWGIIVQGAFLLLFDVFQARRVPLLRQRPWLATTSDQLETPADS